MVAIKTKLEKVAHLIFIAPSMLFIVLLAIVPLCYAVYLSFRSYSLILPVDQAAFNGLDNYIAILTNRDFQNSVWWTLLFCFCTVIISVGMGLLIAVLLTNQRDSPGVRLLKSLLVLPMMVAPVVSSTMWKIMFGAVYGPINWLIQVFGGTPVSWTGKTWAARMAIVIIDSWGSIPFCMLIFIGALTTIPSELYESARVDGANSFTIFWKVTLPMIRNFFALVLSIRVMDSLKVFDPIMIMTDGGPHSSTESIGTIMYKTAFRYMDIGQGSAAAIVFFVLIAIISVATLLLTRDKED